MLIDELDMHQPGERGHSERVAVYATAIGEALGLRGEELRTLRYAAELHDVGKIAVDAGTLSKLGKLSDGELEELRSHAAAALQFVGSVEWLEDAVPIIRHHHERWDGGGYPDGLQGEAVPLGARIIAVAEVFDTLVTGAPWRSALDEEAALDEVERCEGTYFDPLVTAAFFEVQPLIQPVVR